MPCKHDAIHKTGSTQWITLSLGNTKV